MIRNLLREVQTGVVHAETDKGQPSCRDLSDPRPVTSSWVGDHTEVTCEACIREISGTPDSN